MRIYIYLLFSGLFLFALGCNEATDPLPRIAIAGLGIESSTFSPAKTTEEAFHAQHGLAILENYPFLTSGHKNRERAQYFPALRGKALPGGIVPRVPLRVRRVALLMGPFQTKSSRSMMTLRHCVFMSKPRWIFRKKKSIFSVMLL